ncbi:hypothetical protein ACODT3_43175 [Streptomyces sp. 4.24]|uniref:hypothetical protein n=1 Tax=Streptomyces tritrimontium TaxID=3406573 RepID=UPI003BB7BAAF
MSTTQRVHRCTGHCRCPLHGTQLYYWPAGGLHACQDANCGYAQGISADGLATAPPQRTRVAAELGLPPRTLFVGMPSEAREGGQ